MDAGHTAEQDQFPAPVADKLVFNMQPPAAQDHSHFDNHAADAAQLHSVVNAISTVTVESPMPDFFHFLHDDQLLLK